MDFRNSEACEFSAWTMSHFLNCLMTLDRKLRSAFFPSIERNWCSHYSSLYTDRLKKLQKLELRDNCLNSLPVSFGELLNLEFLDLGGNDFVSVVRLNAIRCVKNIFQTLIEQVTTLSDLFYFKPTSIGLLQSLLDLWLDDNQMTSLPDVSPQFVFSII